jgi:ABC-type antimicrobial peptide transport system permease subunit
LIGAAWGIRLLPTLSAGNLRLLDYVHLDIQTVVVALLLVFVINTVFSMLCVVQFNPQKLVKTLNNIGNKGVSSGKVTLLSRILFILQLSFASLVLVGSVLLAKSAYEEFNVDFGFARKNTAVLNITYHPLESATDSASQEDTTDDNFDDVGIAIREQVTSTLLKNFKKMHVLQAQDDPLGVFAQLTLWKNPDDGEILTFIAKNIGPDYINIFDIPLLLGRNMTEKEYQNRDNVVLINSTMARVLAKSDDLATVLSKEFNGAQIIGVIPEHYTFTQEDKGYAQVLYNDWNWSELGQKVVVLLPKGDTFDSDKVISLIESSHPLIKEVDMIVIEERWSERSLSARVQFYAISVLCIVTLLLAAIGSQGMAMNFAELKRFELAIRMTTGASRWGLIKRVVKEFSGLLVISFTVACAIASGVYGSVNQRTDVLPPLTWQSMSVLNSVLLMLVLGTVVFVVWRVVSANPMGILREQ